MHLMLLVIVVVSAAVAATLGGRELLCRRVSPTAASHAEKVVPFLLGSPGGYRMVRAGADRRTSSKATSRMRRYVSNRSSC